MLTVQQILNMSGKCMRIVHLNSEELDNLIDEKENGKYDKSDKLNRIFGTDAQFTLEWMLLTAPPPPQKKKTIKR